MRTLSLQLMYHLTLIVVFLSTALRSNAMFVLLFGVTTATFVA